MPPLAVFKEEKNSPHLNSFADVVFPLADVELHSVVSEKKKKMKLEGGGKGNRDINLKREAFGHQK